MWHHGVFGWSAMLISQTELNHNMPSCEAVPNIGVEHIAPDASKWIDPCDDNPRPCPRNRALATTTTSDNDASMFVNDTIFRGIHAMTPGP